MDHEAYKEMLALDALDALDEAEWRALSAHLAECAECRAEVEEMRATVAALAYSVTPVAPPEALRATILERIKRQKQITREKAPAGGREEVVITDNGGGARLSAGEQSNIVPIQAARRGRWKAFTGSSALTFGALAASVIVVIALGITLILYTQRNDELRTRIARLSNELQQTREDLARVRGDEELMAEPGAYNATLKGTNVAPGARAILAYDPRTGQAVLYVHDLPPPPAGKAYQLWFIANGKPLPGKVFTPDKAGRARLRDQIPVEGRGASLFAVTLEPQSGASAPTGDKFLLGAIS